MMYLLQQVHSFPKQQHELGGGCVQTHEPVGDVSQTTAGIRVRGLDGFLSFLLLLYIGMDCLVIG